VHEAVVVRESAIAGRGLFADMPFDEGTVVIRMGGQLVDTDELRRLMETSEHYVDTLTVVEDVHLVLPPATTAHFGNHSCDPNLWHDAPYAIATRRPVRAGDELTIDYATQTGAPGFAMPCRCGAASCRGEVTSEDWRRADLQGRYAGHWVPALEDRIAQEG
jgi:hypothetical protein